jgi:Bacterial low temperature requirement A protein (LtrA)
MMPSFARAAAYRSASASRGLQSQIASPAAVRSEEIDPAAGELCASAGFGSSAKRRVIFAPSTAPRGTMLTSSRNVPRAADLQLVETYGDVLPDLELDVAGNVHIEHEVSTPPSCRARTPIPVEQPVTVMHLTLYALSARRDPDVLAAIMRVAPSALIGAALIIVAGFFDGGLKPILWLAALIVAFFVPLALRISGWRVQPAHFAERHGLIVIIAIGESLIAIGLGEEASGLSAEVIVAAILGFAVATAFWLAYFDFFTIRAHQLLADRSGAERAALARDVYSYLHFPMVAGIVLFAFAMKTALADVDGELATIPALGLCGGPALYLFAFVALRVRVSRTLRGGRLTAAIVLALLWPVAVTVPALLALMLVAIVWIALHAYEIICWREARSQTRALRVPASQSD